MKKMTRQQLTDFTDWATGRALQEAHAKNERDRLGWYTELGAGFGAVRVVFPDEEERLWDVWEKVRATAAASKKRALERAHPLTEAIRVAPPARIANQAGHEPQVHRE